MKRKTILWTNGILKWELQRKVIELVKEINGCGRSPSVLSLFVYLGEIKLGRIFNKTDDFCGNILICLFCFFFFFFLFPKNWNSWKLKKRSFKGQPLIQVLENIMLNYRRLDDFLPPETDKIGDMSLDLGWLRASLLWMET